RSRLRTNGRATASTAQIPSDHRLQRRTDKVIPSHAANGMTISSPALYVVVSQDASSTPSPSAPRISGSANEPTRLLKPAIMAESRTPASPAAVRPDNVSAASAPAVLPTAGIASVQLRLVETERLVMRSGNGPEADVDPIPRVDRHDGEG